LQHPKQDTFGICLPYAGIPWCKDLSQDCFADMFAQTAAYGLFSAGCSKKTDELTAESLTDMIPETSRFLHEILSVFFSDIRKGKTDADEF
jgi:hypothetical protein